MLARVALVARQHAQPARGMATAQALRNRVKSIKNLRKLTVAMKMVAVCKLRVAQENLANARSFQRSLDTTWKNPVTEPAIKSHMWVGLSSDKGLCGGINSTIVRSIRDGINKDRATNSEKTRMIVLYGEKCRQGLERMFVQYFRATLSETSKFRPNTFTQCGELADFWLAQNPDKTTLFFQKFKSMIAYETTEETFYSYDLLKDNVPTDYAGNEIEGDAEMLRNLYEFRVSVKLFHYFAENETSTLSARMLAMDNSSKNAKELIESLTLLLNRNRQAKITNEIAEICGGAAAAAEI